MLTAEIRIVIPGRPAPKGSLTCVGRPGGRHQLIEDNKRTKPWRNTIAAAIREQWPHDQHAAPYQPIGAEVTTSHERPAGHYGSGRNAQQLKADADPWPVTRTAGDLDKLARLVLDAIQDTDVLPDDAQVCELHSRKVYARPHDPIDTAADVLPCAGVVIRLYPL